MKAKKTELVKTQPKAITKMDTSPDGLIEIAVKNGASPEQLSQLLDLKIKHDKHEAMKAYHEAMAEFKKNPPQINKNKAVSYKDTKYNHASLDNVTEKINKALSPHGLSASWIPEQTDAKIKVTCRITHKLGHSEECSLTHVADTSGGKNGIQGIGSTLSYLERYTILALTGLATGEMDDDGKKSEAVPMISEKEQMIIVEILDNLPNSKQRTKNFLAYLNVKDVSEIPAKKLAEATRVLKLAQAKS